MDLGLSDGIAVLALVLSFFCLWQSIRLSKLGRKLSASEKRTEFIIKVDYNRRNLAFLRYQLNGVLSWFKRHAELSKSIEEDQGAEKPGEGFQVIPSLESMILKIDTMLKEYDSVRDQLFALTDVWDELDFEHLVAKAEGLMTESGDVESNFKRLVRELEKLIREYDERA